MPITRRVGRAFLLAAAPALVLACGDPGPGREAVGSSTSAYTFPNDGPAYDYFVAKGLTSFQAAGIVGNLDQESGDDPTAVQYGGGPGRGLAQWSVGGRWDTDSADNATWYAGTEGKSVWAMDLQLDFIWYELTTFPGYGLAALKATTNVTDATVAFQNDFEGCGTCDESQRVAYAMAVLAAFGSTPVDAGPPAPDAGVPCVETMTGASGVCMDTTRCVTLGGTSTPNYCPGPASEQCCTGFDAGSPAAHDSGAPDAPTPDSSAGDAGVGGAGHHPMSPGPLEDASSPDEAGATFDKRSSGCSASPMGGDGSRGWPLLGALGWMGLGRRRRT